MDALSGIRVIEFSAGFVGPVAGDVMARMGAEVIRVESRRHLDFTRLVRDPVSKTQPKLNEERLFNDINLNKLGLCVNVTKPQGLELVKRLIVQSDVLLENFSAGTIEKLGMGYNVIRQLRPDIVMVSASGSGRGGRDSGNLSVASIFTGLAGMAELTGYPDGAPFEARSSNDVINSFTVTMSILVALTYRHKTGKGQYIDYSSREGLSCLIGDAFMDYFMNGRIQTRRANRDDIMAPHNCYRCQGEDKWVSIAVRTEVEWRALVKAMGNPVWAKQDKFCTGYTRWHNQDELDEHINQWTQNFTAHQVMEKLQKIGVAAFPSVTGEDLLSDPHLAKRDTFDIIEHPLTGANVEITCPWKLSATPPQNRRHAPLLGEHNEYVFKELLGLTSEEIAKLEAEKVFW